MYTRDRLRMLGVAVAIALALSGSARAQQERRGRADATALGHQWLIGRFRMPVTCVRADGSALQIEEAIVIRRTLGRGGVSTLKATFFGIDVADVSSCFNLRSIRVPDQRGTLYLSFLSHQRSDLGLSDFRRRLRRGDLRYPIQGGTLRSRKLGREASEPRILSFKNSGAHFVVRQIVPGSSADKLLRRHGGESSENSRLLRRFEFEIQGLEDFSFRRYVIEDPEWRR